MRKKIKRTAVIVAGAFFLLLGVIGLALPFLQGVLFIIIGLLLLSAASSRIRTWMEAHTRPYPKLHAMVEKTEAWLLRIIGPLESDD